MTVLLVRHGETTWNVEERVQGWAGSPLSGRGREQARATGAHLADRGVDRLVVSDLQRTQETARLFEESGLDAPVAYERAWRERDFGEYQGLDRETVARRHPEFDGTGSLTGVGEMAGGESRERFRERVLDGWDTLRETLADETVAVVTHGGPIRVVVAAIEARPFPELAREWAPANCGVTEIDAAVPRVVDRDHTAHH
jgi:probable phosphoglycerate mutase